MRTIHNHQEVSASRATPTPSRRAQSLQPRPRIPDRTFNIHVQSYPSTGYGSNVRTQHTQRCRCVCAFGCFGWQFRSAGLAQEYLIGPIGTAFPTHLPTRHNATPRTNHARRRPLVMVNTVISSVFFIYRIRCCDQSF